MTDTQKRIWELTTEIMWTAIALEKGVALSLSPPTAEQLPRLRSIRENIVLVRDLLSSEGSR